MSLFISNAYASAAPAPAGSGLIGLLPLVLMAFVFWFLILRPQLKRNKEHRTMIDSLQTGSEVVFAGGLLGRVKKLDNEFAVVILANGLDVKIQKTAIVSVLPDGTLKKIDN